MSEKFGGMGGGDFSKKLEDSKKVQQDKTQELNTNTELLIGKERFGGLTSTLDQLSEGVKLLISKAEKNEAGSGEKIENLLRDVSNNLYGHVSSTNGNPEKLIKALEELRDRTNFG